MKKISLLVFLLLASYFGHTQDLVLLDSSITKTIEMQPVVIQSIPIEKYAAGSSIQKISTKQLENESHSTLDDLLTKYSAIYLKEYGNGMLSSVSMRGTGSSHTAVLWNGININSLTLGSLDFSLVPMSAIDRVDVHFGSASSLYGSDAIGGSIHLSTVMNWDDRGLMVKAQQEFGSFGTWYKSANVSFNSGALYTRTNVYHKTSKNNFSFVERSVKQRQNHAAYQFYGIVQDVGLRITPQQTLLFSGWFNFNDREIQPNKSANLFPSNETIQDKNLRMTLDYKLDNKIGFFNIKTAYVHDHQYYRQQNAQTVVATHRLVNVLQYEKDLHSKLTLRVGGEWTHIITDVDSYERTIRETRNDGYISLNFSPSSWWTTTLNIRKTFMYGHKSPFTPSLGNNITILKNNNHQLVIKALAAKGYRIPTLNDRYWTRSGNPFLLPENSLSLETGIKYRFRNSRHQLNIETTGYTMKVDDMIHWIPISSDFWEPQNFRKVNVDGIELHVDYERAFSEDITISVFGNYALTRSLNKVNAFEGDATLDKQLPYTPVHCANLISSLKIKKWSGNLANYYTGERFTNLSHNEVLSPYLLTDLGISRSFALNRMHFDITLNVNNIFNIEYQNYTAKAMPGINYQAGIKFQFK